MSTKTAVDIEKICRVCLHSELDMKLIFESEENTTVAQMLSELTIYKVQRFDNLPHLICLDCFDLVLNAYKIKKLCEKSFRTLVDMIDAGDQDNLDKSLQEKGTQTEVFSVYLCERCNEKFFSYDALRHHQQNEHKGNEIICRYCSRSFDRICNLKSHLAVFHPDSGFKTHSKCHICKKQFTRLAHKKRHLRIVHKMKSSDFKTPKKDQNKMQPSVAEEEIIKIKEKKDNEDSVLNTKENIEEIVENEDAFYEIWDGDNLETLTDDEDEKPLVNLKNNKITPMQTIEEDEIETPLADLLNNTASSAQSAQDVLQFNSVEANILTDHITKECLNLNKSTKTVKNIVQPPKRNRGRPLKKPPNCKYCDKSLDNPLMVQQHITKHHIQPEHFPCKHCSDCFTNPNDLENHVTINHNEENSNINCDQAFARHSKGKPKKYNTEKSYECAKCKKFFCNKSSLQRHIENHKRKRFVCKECSEDFFTRDELNDHTKIKGHDKPLLCPECGLRCKSTNILTVHMRRHNGEKPYKCKFCSKGFPRIDDLKIHEKYHTGEKSHFCETCGKGFVRNYNLRIHLRVHTGEKPYKCPHCPQAFAQGNDLKAHIRRHTGERFRCEVCGAAFLQAYQKRQHKLQEHDIHEIPPTQRVKKFTSPEEQEKQIKENLQKELE